MKLPASTRLNLGCNNMQPDGWINLDGAAHPIFVLFPRLWSLRSILVVLRLRKKWAVTLHDLRKPLPFPSESIQSVYASHVLEHLYVEEAELCLAECFRVLEPGGYLRVVVPDLYALVAQYRDEVDMLRNSEPGSSPADKLNQSLLLRPAHAPSGNLFRRIYQCRHDFNTHKWIYDEYSLKMRLERTGFVDIGRRGYLDSNIEGIEVVEIEGRILEGFCLEGMKPEIVNPDQSRC